MSNWNNVQIGLPSLELFEIKPLEFSPQLTPDFFVRKFIEAEERLLKEILFQILQRNPTTEDAKDLCRLQQEGVFNEYKLQYKGEIIGSIYSHFGIDGKYGFEFQPCK